MQDGSFRAIGRRGYGAGVPQFAADIVAKLVSGDLSTDNTLREAVVTRIFDTMLLPCPMNPASLLPDLKRARISHAVFSDRYIPEVARRLGVAWEQDRVSFAELTIGVARLQTILRQIGTTWVDNDSAADGATVLLILPVAEQHTLGAMVVAGWLRRNGISVCLRIAPSRAELADIVGRQRFDAAMISIACEEKLEECRRLVKTLKSESSYKLRVAVGGALLERRTVVVEELGADIVTNDLAKAVSSLGLKRAWAEAI